MNESNHEAPEPGKVAEPAQSSEPVKRLVAASTTTTSQWRMQKREWGRVIKPNVSPNAGIHSDTAPASSTVLINTASSPSLTSLPENSVRTLATCCDTLTDSSTSSSSQATAPAKAACNDEDRQSCASRSDAPIRGCLKVPTHAESLSKNLEEANNSEHRHSVRFHTISIHSHCIRLGDNPSVSIGPPIGIGWKAWESQTVSVDLYEETKPMARDRQEMHIPLKARESILMNIGYSRMEMSAASRLATKIKCNRRLSANDGHFKNAVKHVLRCLSCTAVDNMPRYHRDVNSEALENTSINSIETSRRPNV
jgi:hypothetical protein